MLLGSVQHFCKDDYDFDWRNWNKYEMNDQLIQFCPKKCTLKNTNTWCVHVCSYDDYFEMKEHQIVSDTTKLSSYPPR